MNSLKVIQKGIGVSVSVYKDIFVNQYIFSYHSGKGQLS